MIEASSNMGAGMGDLLGFACSSAAAIPATGQLAQTRTEEWLRGSCSASEATPLSTHWVIT